MKISFIAIAILIAFPTFAQVSCSASVDPEICKAVSNYASGIKAPIEIVTATEYKTRLAVLDEQEVRSTVNSYPNDENELKASADTKIFTIYHKHVLRQDYTPGISFLRDSPSAGYVARILVSEEEFQGIDFSKPKVDAGGITHFPKTGKYEPTTVENFVTFSVGFMEGTHGTLFDGTARGDQLLRVMDERKKIGHGPGQ